MVWYDRRCMKKKKLYYAEDVNEDDNTGVMKDLSESPNRST